MNRVTNTPPGVWRALQPGSSISLPRIVLDGTAEISTSRAPEETDKARPSATGRTKLTMTPSYSRSTGAYERLLGTENVQSGRTPEVAEIST